MAEWAVCPQCQLKHRPRPDGHCPRCRHVLDAAPEVAGESTAFEPPAAPATPDDSASVPPPDMAAAAGAGAETNVTTAARIAGGVLLLNGVLALVEKAMAPQAGAAAGVFSSPVSMVIDLIVGGMLIAGKGQALPWAKFRTVGGGIILPIVYLVQDHALLAVFQAIFSSSVALLLFGRPARVRLGTGLAGAGLCVALEIVGLTGIGAGKLAGLAMAGQLESEPVTVVEGLKFAYQLTPPNNRWYLRKEELARRDNPLVDRWIVRPDIDAHVMVIAEELPDGAVVDMDRFREAVLANARQHAKEFQDFGFETLSPHIDSRLLHTRSRVGGLAVETLVGLYAVDRCIFQVMAVAPQKEFSGVSSDLRAIIESFERE